MSLASQQTIQSIGGDSRSPRGFSESRPAQIDFSYTSEQPDCILFTRLPGEIRATIFEYVLAPGPNLQEPYPADRVYHRPDMQHHPKTDIALLLTCKLIFREARLMPVSQATHYFWIFGGPWRHMRAGVSSMAGWSHWQASLSPEQRQAVQHVHIFAQQVHLESLGIKPNLRYWQFATKNLRITLRHSDWWSWESPAESSDRLGICPWMRGRTSHQGMLAQPLALSQDELRERMVEGTWGWQIGQVQGLQRLEIEFETDVDKKEQLQKVLDRAQHWVFPLSGQNAALVKSGDLVESTWEGSAVLRDDFNTPHPLLLRRRSMGSSFPITRDEQHPSRTYYVAVMTWKVISMASEEYVARANPEPQNLDEGGY